MKPKIADAAAAVVEGVKDFVGRRLAPVEDRVADAERRLRALELRFESEQRGLGYKGIYREGETYPKGAFCTHQGGLWFAWADTDARPGTDDSWQLAVKSPRR